MVFVQSWWGIVTNASKMRCEKFGCKSNWSWSCFGWTKFGELPFSALVAKFANKWSYGFCAILVGNCHKCIKNEVWKVWLQNELILVGFWLSQVRWFGFFVLIAKLVNDPTCWPERWKLPRQRIDVCTASNLRSSLRSTSRTCKETERRRCGRSHSNAQVSDDITKY